MKEINWCKKSDNVMEGDRDHINTREIQLKYLFGQR